MTEPAEISTILTTAAEQVLSNTLNCKIQFQSLEPMTEPGRRNLLLRCHVDPIDGLPASFILKKVEADPYNPDNIDSWDTMRFFRDWVGAEFLNQIPRQVDRSPVFYAGDRQLGFIILEDIAHQSSLVEPLLGSDRALAETLLLQYSTCLGQLHSDTIGKKAVFDIETILISAKPLQQRCFSHNCRFK